MNHSPRCGCDACAEVEQFIDRVAPEPRRSKPQPRDPLIVMASWRPWQHVDARRYQAERAKAMRPTLGQLRMIEAAIGCKVACDAAVAAWRGVSA